MSRYLDCTILTPERAIFQGEVSSVVAPGVDGYLGILYNHAPLITALAAGDLKVTKSDGSESYWKVRGGFLEVLRNKVSVLAEDIEAFEKKRTDWV